MTIAKYRCKSLQFANFYTAGLGNANPGGIFQTRVYGFGGLQTRVPGYPGLMYAHDIGLPINLACGGYTWQCRLAVMDLAYRPKQLRCYPIGDAATVK